MRKRGLCCGLVAATLTLAPAAAAHSVVAVGYRTPTALRGLHVVSRIPALRVAQVRVASDRAVARLRARPGVRFVDRLVPRRRSGGPSLPVPLSVPEWQTAAVHLDLVPDWVEQAASRVTIAIVDTGADVSVPALAAKHPTTWNVVTGTSTVQDQVGHGTFVASLAGGTVPGGNGMVGFGGDAKLMIVQANRGTAAFSDLDEANGIVWAVDHGANIVNLSLGGTQTSQVERAAVEYAIAKGVLLVAAAGNAGQQGNPVMYPAALIGRRGLVVGAADDSGKRAGFSSTGAYVDVLAPGVSVLGALAPGTGSDFFTLAPTPGAAGTYGYGSGTSYAAPEVAGAAALVMAANPSLGAAAVAQTIEGTASGNGAWAADTAFGNVDVAAAVSHAATGTVPTLSDTTSALIKPAATRKAKSHKK